ncbi:MAG: hypothetical protein MK214_15110 [Thalassotalea sp.]|nr:hypothetical protein [Thalassotalea sp.]
MKLISLSLLLTGIVTLTGCQATAPNASTKLDSNRCTPESYSNLEGPEFLYVGEPRYVTNYFDVAYDSSNYRYGKEHYSPLIGSKFKFTGTLSPKESAYQNPYVKVIEIDDDVTEFESNIKSMVITESCNAFWFSGHVNYNYITGKRSGVFKKSDNSKVTFKDFQFVYGSKNATPYDAAAEIEVDKFAKTATIKTKYTNSLMLRAWSNSELSKKPNEIQIYKEISLADWAHFDRAISDDGQARKLVKIDTDVRNCGSSLGCMVYETVGITVPLSYVRKNKDGFEIQAYGKQKAVIEVPKYQISAMLKAIDNIN